MTELERSLRLLGEALAFPEAPDVSEAVQRRLVDIRPQRRRPSRRTLVLAFAALAVAVGAVMAVPPARTAVLEFFGLRGATVQRVESLPPDAGSCAVRAPPRRPAARRGGPAVGQVAERARAYGAGAAGRGLRRQRSPTACVSPSSTGPGTACRARSTPA